MNYRYKIPPIDNTIANAKSKFENFIMENLWTHWCVYSEMKTPLHSFTEELGAHNTVWK